MKIQKQDVYAVILAGGSGMRMGAVLKQFMSISKKPILWYSLSVFDTCDFIDGIVVVVPKHKIHFTERLIGTFGLQKKYKVIGGGSTRRESSYNALKHIASNHKCSYVVFHDGVRPLLTKEMIRSVYMKAKRYGAAVLASQVLNVIVTQKNKLVTNALHADHMYNTQTPHCYRFDVIKNAHEQIQNRSVYQKRMENIELVTISGGTVALVDSYYRNMKLTFKQDVIPLTALIKYGAPKIFSTKKMHT